MVRKLKTAGLGFYMSDEERIPKLGMCLITMIHLDHTINTFVKAIYKAQWHEGKDPRVSNDTTQVGMLVTSISFGSVNDNSLCIDDRNAYKEIDF